MNDQLATAPLATRALTVVLSLGQSQNPAKRQLEQEIVDRLVTDPRLTVLVVPNLYDLTSDSEAIAHLRATPGDLVVLAWLYERATHWILDRHGIRGRRGTVYLRDDMDDADDKETHDEASEANGEAENDKPRVADSRDPADRSIYCLDLRLKPEAQPFVDEVARIAAEVLAERSKENEALRAWIQGNPSEDQMQRYLRGGSPNIPGDTAATLRGALRLDHDTNRRWYPVIDYSRCTNCMECIDFCLFGVYGVDGAETILVEQPDNCRKGCPACSRVCPENAIIFPQHKTPAIAGAPAETGGSLKIDLSQLFGAPSAVELAAMERDEQLVAAGREAVGLSIGIPKRQSGRPAEPQDELDKLIDELDELDV